MPHDKQQAMLDDYCKPERSTSFEAATAALNDAEMVAGQVVKACQQGRQHDDAEALVKQYDFLKPGITKMQTTIQQICKLRNE